MSFDKRSVEKIFCAAKKKGCKGEKPQAEKYRSKQNRKKLTKRHFKR